MVKWGEWRSERVKAILIGFTMEKGFRGRHFEHISGFEGEREILGGIPGYFSDSNRIGAAKRIISRISGKGCWEGMEMVATSFTCTTVAS